MIWCGNGSFDDFLDEEGLRADAEATANKRVLAYQIEMEMKHAKLSKTAMAKKMRPSRTALGGGDVHKIISFLFLEFPPVIITPCHAAGSALGRVYPGSAPAVTRQVPFAANP